MPVPPRRKKRKSKLSKEHIHPFTLKLNTKLSELNVLLNKIYDLAHNDLLVANAETGLNDYSMSEKFVKKLQDTSKLVLGLANRLSEEALKLQDTIDDARDRKRIASGIISIEEVTDPKRKCPETKKKDRIKFIPSTDFRIKTEIISDSEPENDKPVSGELDTRFMYPKTNENPAEIHSFICDHCEGVFRDQHELRNHYTNHKIEFYTCLKCDKIFRSVRGFEGHRKTHATVYECADCSKTFSLKTSLTNHAQVHSTERLECSHDECDRTFKHRQNQLEHVKWGHRDKKECPCNICGKLFQTPTNMRTHRTRIHGYVEELLPGHPHAEQARKRRLAMAAQRAEEKKQNKKQRTSQSDENTQKTKKK